MAGGTDKVDIAQWINPRNIDFDSQGKVCSNCRRTPCKNGQPVRRVSLASEIILHFCQNHFCHHIHHHCHRNQDSIVVSVVILVELDNYCRTCLRIWDEQACLSWPPGDPAEERDDGDNQWQSYRTMQGNDSEGVNHPSNHLSLRLGHPSFRSPTWTGRMCTSSHQTMTRRWWPSTPKICSFAAPSDRFSTTKKLIFFFFANEFLWNLSF